MASVMELIIRAKDEASQVMESVSEKGGKAANWLEDNWIKVGVATAAVGASLEVMNRKMAPLTETTRQLSLSLGMTEKEVNALARELSNVTLPLEDVLGLMEVARSQGLRTREELENFVNTWDMIGDATGENAVELAKAGAALRALGIEAGEEEQVLASFGFIQRETTMTVSEFLRTVERMAPEMLEMGVSVNDAAALLGILEREMGLTSITARQELRQAINETEGDMTTLLETLGISSTEFDRYRNMVEQNSNTIRDNATAHAESYTMMQKLQHGVSELAYQYGDLIMMVGNLTPLLIALGPIIKILSMIKANYTVVTTAATAATIKFGAATKTFLLSPMGLIIMAVAAAVAAVWYLWQNWEKAVDFLQGLWQGFVDFFVGIWDFMTGIVQGVIDFWVGIFDKFVGAIKSFFQGLADFIGLVWEGIKDIVLFPIRLIIKAANTIIRAMNKIKISIPDWIPGIGGKTFGINIPEIPMLYEGGVVRSPQLAIVGERKEAILPLNPLQSGTRRIETLLQRLIEAQREPSTNERGRDVHLHIGTLIADESGLRKLQRELNKYTLEENRRRGVIG